MNLELSIAIILILLVWLIKTKIDLAKSRKSESRQFVRECNRADYIEKVQNELWNQKRDYEILEVTYNNLEKGINIGK